MKPEHWERIKQLCHSVLEQEPGRRQEFLRQACAGDESLRIEVESMLARGGGSPDTLESPALQAEIQALASTPECNKTGPTLSHDKKGEHPDYGGMRLDEFLCAGTRLGPYQILAPIGSGGMGKVYKARDTRLDRLVAIKISREEFSERFEREARAVAALNHPHVCMLYDVGPNYLVMEYIDGTPLTGPLPLKNALEYASQILDALEAAHGKGIVHRDLKPSNILRTKQGIKLLDFGLAKVERPRTEGFASGEETGSLPLTRPGAVVGTPAYMSPEQWEGEPADARSDIYSFGCVLYEMLTGKRAAQERIPVRPLAIENILRRCLARDPGERWQSAGELRDRLALASVHRKRKRFAISAIATIAASLAAVLFWPRTHAAPLTDRDVLVLAEFSNSTGDPVFDVALREALAAQLEESPFLKVLSDEQVREDLRLMKRPSARVTNEIAREICLREGSKATIGGSISSFGKSYAISLQAVNCQTGETLARQQVEAEDKEHVLRAVATAATGMRAKLGESLSSIQKLYRPKWGVTTTSLEAFQAYAFGLEQIHRGSGHTAAIPFAQRATELDPNFASGWELLGNAYRYGLGARERQNEYIKKAFSLVDRVSEWERLRISAFYYEFVTAEYEKAIDILHLLIKTYPRRAAPHNTLGLYYLDVAGEMDKAAHEFQEALRLEHIPGYFTNLIVAYTMLGRLKEAKSIAEEQLKEFPQVGESQSYHGFLSWMAQVAGDRAAEQREIQWFISRSLEHRALPLQASNAWRAGRLRRANKLMKRAVELARIRKDLRFADELLLTDAKRKALLGDCRAALSNLRAIRTPAPPLLEYSEIAADLAFCGDTARAEELADEISQQFPKATVWQTRQLPGIRAAMALSHNKPAEAIELLRFIVPENVKYRQDAYVRGMAYLRLGKGMEAAADFQTLLDHNPGTWDCYPLVKVGLARGLAIAGDIPRAKRIYEDFFSFWKDADADAPLLLELRKEYAALN